MRILIVEDQEKLATFIEKGLKSEGYSVDIALDGEKGLQYAFMNDYDLILLDVNLPKISGFELCKSIRKEKPRVPILFLTGSTATDEKIKGLNLGADDYITKPFHLEELSARIRAITRRAENMKKSSKIEIADLSIDLLKREVFRSGKKIDLSAHEFSLLEYLASRKDHVLSRSLILEHVWQKSFDVGSNVVDVHINHLRSKIDANFKKPLIHTVRGSGYTIREE
jgi:DNA-binding response OmpR family regulator